MKVIVIPIVIGALGTVTKGLIKGLEDLEIRMSGDHSNCSIVEIGQIPGELRRLAVTSIHVENNQLTIL